MFRSHSTNFKAQSNQLKNDSVFKSLDLSRKNITEFPDQNLLIKSLNASSNFLTTLTPQMINALLSYRKLTSLDLSDNLLTEFPEELNQLKHLEKLNLFYNRFQNIDIKIASLKNLNLSQNRLTALPPNLPPNLQTLSFDFNLLHGLAFSHATLTKLTLVLTELEWISPDISFPSLLHLDLSKNNLAMMPNLTKLAPKLEFLDLSDNFLPEMPIPPLSIKEYIIKQNLILELPSNLCKFKNLINLNVSNNHIEFIPALPPSIEALVFAQNEVSQIEPCCTPKLKKLYIRNNKLTTYPQYDKLKIREYSAGFNNISILRPLPCIDFIQHIHNMTS